MKQTAFTDVKIVQFFVIFYDVIMVILFGIT